MIGAEMLCHAPRMRELVERGLVEPDRKRLHASARRLRHQADDKARVDASGQEGAERNVADEMRSDRIRQHVAQVAHGVGFGPGISLVHRQLPVLVDRELSVAPDEQVTGWQFADALEDRPVRRRVQE